jgi:hypothetical protein
MSKNSLTPGLLRAKDYYNRMSLHVSWAHRKQGSDILKFDRLRLGYGDSRTDVLSERRKIHSEGLKI